MKAYDSVSIKSRLISRLRKKDTFKNVIEDSAIDSFTSEIAEMEAEDVRYFEQCLRERTWNQSQNLTSVVEQAGFHGYIPNRRISAIGNLVFSYTDLENLSEEDLENLPGSTIPSVTIASQTPILYNSIPFLTTNTKTLENGQKYIKVPIIQGEVKTIRTDIQKLLGIPFEKIKILDSTIEAGSDSVSETFFSVQLQLPDNSIETCTKVDNIFLADSDEYAFDVKNVFNDADPSEDYIILRFGNNVTGKIPPKDSVVIINYLSSLGKNGCIEDVGVISGSVVIDGYTLFYKGYAQVVGGKEREEMESIKANAPSNYLQSGSIISKAQYKKAIEKLPYVYKATVYAGIYKDPLSLAEKEAIVFSAINDYGEEVADSDIETDLNERIEDDKSPLDLVKYTPPDFVDIQYNFKASRKNVGVDDATQLKGDITNLIYSRFGILAMDFSNKIETNEIGSYILNNYSNIYDSYYFTLAKSHLKTSEFISSSANTIYKEFSFNPSFIKILKLNTLPYYLKMDIVWACDGQEEYNRSLFLIENPFYDPLDGQSLRYQVKQFPYIPLILTNSTMQDLLEGNILAYKEIKDTDPDYIDITINIDWNSELMEGSIIIPSSYIDPQQSDSDLDNCISIDAYAFPQNYQANIIYPISKNGIVRLKKDNILVEIS